MSGKERITAALQFREYDAVPIESEDVIGAPFTYPGWFRGGYPGRIGKYTDGWGCEWHVLENGVCGEVKGHPLSDWKNFDSFRPPYDILRRADLSNVNRTCAENPDKFVMNRWEPAMPNIFERMQHLRGTEQLFMDIAYGDARLFRLRDVLQEYFLTQFEMWCKTDVDAMHIHDDWGTQISLLISPQQWRSIFKPLYKQYCDMAHRYGKFVVMHSDGYIADILPDLLEIGVNAINSQLFCMPIEELAEKYHHKLCFWGELDRQWIQPFGKPSDVVQACYRIAKAFFRYGKTGFVAQCYYTMNTPQENKDAERECWRKIDTESFSEY